MLVFGTQVHVVTFLFIIIEFGLFCIQLYIYLLHTGENRRGWYLILLGLLLLYNITGGLFPDPKLSLSISLQEMIAYGTGFLMASYFPFYFYKAFGLRSLRWHALFGVPLFLMAPYVAFFVVMYAINGDLAKDMYYGLVAPFIYSLILLWAILTAIRKHYKQNRDRNFYLEEIAVYCAITPWASMTLLSWFQVNQLTEVLFTNTGFIAVTLVFFWQSIQSTRRQQRMLSEGRSATFEANCKRYKLSPQETNIAMLLADGLTYKEIAAKLFLSENTVDNYIQRVYEKTGVRKRQALINKLSD